MSTQNVASLKKNLSQLDQTDPSSGFTTQMYKTNILPVLMLLGGDDLVCGTESDESFVRKRTGNLREIVLIRWWGGGGAGISSACS